MPSLSSNASPETQLSAGYEPIRGYRLERPIGRGGFGEVWQANAPGDLKKAVKFVFGHHDGSRASREMKSLERIRAIRHPFLLTLERFEIVGDRLVIVTELADGSLEDIYKRHREAGSCGIPRETLLKNLADTADGLDYLHQQFGLQHLDVKPANLLIVGGHVKVADFGLLKDLGDVDCSVVGGLTPIYAPPELFDGRPSLHSDQYSLAVMYQEMLTGTRPFAGRTIAQLATQHVHSTPNLEPLPPRDRATVARALEKDPDRRFASCQEFIDELQRPSSKSLPPQHEVAVDPAVVIDHLPQIEDRHAAATSHATRLLVVALGGTGVDCLCELKQLAMSRCTETQIDAVAIDTDIESGPRLRIDRQYQDRFRFRSLYTPLRTASEYRHDANSRFASISRRWIYNVPKDGSTQSMRPMGRLAMVDHGEAINEALNEAIAKSSQQDQISDLKVFVVGSLGGGTGSGMYIDVVHQLRHLLDEHGHQSANIVSLLSSHSFTGEDSARLAYHNTHASLLEIHHFLKAENGYPGDEGAGFHSVPAARTPLRQLYLIPGHQMSKFGCRPVQTIVNYLWNASHEAASLLDEARSSTNDDTGAIDRPSIRTVGIISIGQASDGHHQRMSRGLVSELLSQWLGTPKQAKANADVLLRRVTRRSGLTPDYVFGAIRKTVGKPESPESIDENRLYAAPNDGSMDYVAAGICNQLHREASIVLGDRRYNLSTMIEATTAMQAHTESMVSQWRDRLAEEDPTLAPEVIEQLIVIADHVIKQVVCELEFLLQRLECLAAIIAVATVEMSREETGEDPWRMLPDAVQSQRGKLLEKLHQSTVNSFLVRPLNDPNSNLDPASISEQLLAFASPHLVSLIQEMSDAFDDADSRVLRDAVADSSVTHGGGHVTKPQATRVQLHQTQAFHRADDEPGQDDGPMTVESIEDAVAIIRPPLIEFGGSQRMILLVSDQAQRLEMEPLVRRHYEGAVSVAVRKGVAPTLIHEAESVPVQSLVTRLEVIGGDSQITSRLAGRIDVEWSTI